MTWEVAMQAVDARDFIQPEVEPYHSDEMLVSHTFSY